MARKGLLSLAGFFTGGGSVNVPAPNPPVPPEVTDTQTVRLPLVSDGQTVFPLTVARSANLQGIVMPLVTSTQTVFELALAQRTTLPFVVNTPIVLPLSVSIVGSFSETFDQA